MERTGGLYDRGIPASANTVGHFFVAGEELMVNRHVVTKQRAPSIKSIIERLEVQLAVEVDPKGREQLERYLDYWKGRRNHANRKV